MALFSRTEIHDKFEAIEEDEFTPSESETSWSKLEKHKGEENVEGIFAYNIRFFNQSLLQTTKVALSKHKDGRVKWLLKFFSGTKSEVFIRVFIYHRDQDPETPEGEEARQEVLAFNGKGSNDKKAFCRLIIGGPDVTKSVSEYLRGSQTFDLIKETDSYSPEFLVATAGSKACFVHQPTNMKKKLWEKEKNLLQRFERLVLLQALALAYRSVIDDHAFRQTKAVLDIVDGKQTFNELKSLREEVVNFDAAFVFDKPVHNEGQHEVSAFWEHCSSAFGLRGRRGELNDQNDSVYNILARKEAEEKREREMQSEDNRRAHEKKSADSQSRWNLIFTFLLAFFGIGVALVEPALQWTTVGDFIASSLKLLFKSLKYLVNPP